VALLTVIPKDNEVAAMSDVGERVKKIVVKHLGVEAEKVTENAAGSKAAICTLTTAGANRDARWL
jgi:hypothetical protein